MDEQNDKTKKPMPKKGTGPELHNAAGFSEVHNLNARLPSVILTGVISAMPRRGRLFCKVALFRQVYHVVTMINLASRFNAEMSFTVEGSRLVLFTSGVRITIDVRIRGDSNRASHT